MQIMNTAILFEQLDQLTEQLVTCDESKVLLFINQGKTLLSTLYKTDNSTLTNEPHQAMNDFWQNHGVQGPRQYKGDLQVLSNDFVTFVNSILNYGDEDIDTDEEMQYESEGCNSDSDPNTSDEEFIDDSDEPIVYDTEDSYSDC